MSINTKRYIQGDLVIWVVFFLLCMVSLVEVFSAASSLSYRTGDFMKPLFKQAEFLALGTIVVWFFHAIPCRFFKILHLLGLPASYALIILAWCIGEKTNGADRWIPLFGFTFQPSEFAKWMAIITTAVILSRGQTEAGASPHAMKRILCLCGPLCALIFFDNLSTSVLLSATIFIMLFLARVPMKQLGRLVACGVVGVLCIVLVAVVVPATVFEGTLIERITTWKNRLVTHAQGDMEFPLDSATTVVLNRQMARYDAAMLKKDSTWGKTAVSVAKRDSVRAAKADTLGQLLYLRDHAQEAHANIAIASCNGVGKMPGNSEQRDHLSQAYSDFIYAIIIEEMGVWGAFIVAFLYIILLFRAGRIASRCERNFPAYLTMGLAILMVMQAMMNILVAVGIAPVTGQPLPLISRGGTSTLITCVYFGMILSVSRYARKNMEGKKVEILPPSGEDKATAEAFQSNEGMH